MEFKTLVPRTSRSLSLGALALLILVSQSLPLYAQQTQIPAGGPILKISPAGQPSQWQAPITQQSNPTLPPVPSMSVSSTNTTNNTPGKASRVAPLVNTTPKSEAAIQSSPNTALTVGANSQRIPAGTYLNVRFNTALDSKSSPPGQAFTATLLEDFLANQQVVLPAGTLVRGRLEEVRRPTFFSKGGALYLMFDHVVMPTGDLMPLDLKLSSQNTKVNAQGAVYQDPGIQKKLGQSVTKGVSTLKKITGEGVQSGKELGDGLGTIITVPVAAVGGALAGTAVTAGSSVVSLVGRGESAIIAPGDTVRIDFGNSFTLPTN